jgi:quercetin 2,3-dioxygenase
MDDYVHVAQGALKVNGIDVDEGDGIRFADEAKRRFGGWKNAEVLLSDLPAE